MERAVILLSGGLDSATVLKIAEQEEYQLYAISFDYGQRHNVELNCATKIAKASPNVIEHKVVKMARIEGSSLTDRTVAINKAEDPKAIPATYVPGRNTIFLSYALSYAETIGARDIFIGANIIDYSQYPDCRPEYIAKFQELANLATAYALDGGKPLEIKAPLMHMSKMEIIALGLQLGADYRNTSSCYNPDDSGRACRNCDACQFRLAGFAANNMTDPIEYRPS